MTLRDERQAKVQAFIDRLSIVERHRVCRRLNWFVNFLKTTTISLKVFERNFRIVIKQELAPAPPDRRQLRDDR
jgi:hypothetical protein